MPHSLLDTVASALQAAGLYRGERLRLGYSGGIDSTVLAKALLELRSDLGFELTLMHVHHGLQECADQWVSHCEASALAWGLPLEIVRLELRPPFEGGLEAAARLARYQALSRPGADRVVLAHHADDQVETVLLQWIRGAGPAGLLGMGLSESSLHHPLTHPLLRPLLKSTRAEIEAFAEARGLSGIEDPSNLDSTRDRNYLRHHVVPRLKSRFPGLIAGVQRSQLWLQEAHALMQALAENDLQSVSAAPFGDPTCLPGSLTDYRRLGDLRARHLIRELLNRRGVRPPPALQLAEWLRQVLSAEQDRIPEVEWSLGVLYRWRDALWFEAGGAFTGAEYDLPLVFGETHLPTGGHLWVMPADRQSTMVKAGDLCLPQGLKSIEGLSLRPVGGEEGLRPSPSRPTRTVRKLAQEAGIPPWRRQRLPGLWRGDQLVAVPGLAVRSDDQVGGLDEGLQVLWRDPALVSLSW